MRGSAVADAGLSGPARGRAPRAVPWSVLAVISAGGVVGALVRYGLQEAFPHRPGGFGWATFGVNVCGCLLIGVLMVVVDEAGAGPRLLRPFLGVGVLGGFTTFSTYVTDIGQGVVRGSPHVALAYLAATLVGALTAVWVGAALTGAALQRRRGRQPR